MLLGFSYVLVLSGLVDFLSVSKITLLACWPFAPRSPFYTSRIGLVSRHKTYPSLQWETHKTASCSTSRPTPALGKSVDRLFLFRSCYRYDLKTRLRKQGFFPGDFTPAGGGRFGCGY